MSQIHSREKTELYIRILTAFLLKNRWQTLIGAIVLSIASVVAITNLKVDTSFEGMLHPDDSVRLEYNDFRDRFGHDRFVTISLRPDNIFDLSFLNKLKTIHNQLEIEIPYVKRVTSLINAPRTYGKDDTLYIEDLLSEWPKNSADLNELRSLTLSNANYRNYILSEDGSVTAIVIETEASIPVNEDDLDTSGRKNHYFTEVEINEISDAVIGVIAPYKSELNIAVTGGPIIDSTFDRIAKADVELLGVLALITILGFLAILFRRVSGVILPNIVVISGMLATLAIMSCLGFAITVFTNILPSVLMAVGIAGSVHILTIFYRSYDDGLDKEEAILEAMAHSGLPIVMTSITTAAGFLSFSVAKLAAVGEMGTVACIGTAVIMFYTLVLLPVIISVAPIRRRASNDNKKTALMDRVLLHCARISSLYPKHVSIAGMLILFVALIALTQLQFYHDMMEDLPDDTVAKQDLFSIERDFKGSIAVEVVIDTGIAGGVKDPLFLKKIESISGQIMSFEDGDIYVGKVSSIVDLVKDVNKALHDNNDAYHIIPDDKELIAQELLLLEMDSMEELERFVDPGYQRARISIKIPWAELFATHRLVESMRNTFRGTFSDSNEITITGMASLMGKTFPVALETMARSYIIAFFVVSIFMIVLVGSVSLGLISMVPNVLPILLILGVMGAADIPLNLAALLIGSIAIGIVVDDIMHIVYNFQKYYELTQNIEKALEKTLLGTGRAICVTSFVLGANFMALSFSTLEASSTFGVMLGLVIAVALIADLTLAPALLVLYSRKARS